MPQTPKGKKHMPTELLTWNKSFASVYFSSRAGTWNMKQKQNIEYSKTFTSCFRLIIKYTGMLKILWNYFSQPVIRQQICMNRQLHWSVSVIAKPSMLQHCWLGSRKGIRPVKNLSDGILAWLSVWMRCRFGMAQLMSLPLTISCSSKSRLVLPE